MPAKNRKRPEIADVAFLRRTKRRTLRAQMISRPACTVAHIACVHSIQVSGAYRVGELNAGGRRWVWGLRRNGRVEVWVSTVRGASNH